MKRVTVTILLYGIMTIGFCQGSNKLYTKTVTEIERGYERQRLVLHKIKEENSDTRDDTIYRIWTDLQLIEIFIAGDTLNHGQIISFIFRIKGKKETITKLHYRIDRLSESESNDILERIEGIDSITITDKSANWGMVLDGDFYSVNRYTNGQIDRKGYYALFNQEIQEIKPIKDLFESLDKDYLTSRKDNFISSLSSGKYMLMNGGLILEKK
jgi:hypothetical protein